LGTCDIAVSRPFRAAPHEVVLEIRAGAARLFFKGLAGNRDAEPRVTAALATLAPESFARTIALERQPDGSVRWLLEACPGSSLARRWTLGCAARGARACAQLQQRAVNSVAVNRALPPIALSSAFEWAMHSLERSLSDGADECRAAIARAGADLNAARIPE